MKLCQKIILTDEQAIKVLISAEKNSDGIILSKVHEMGFHPFLLQAISATVLPETVLKQTSFTLHFTIVDDELQKPIFFGLSPTKSLVLIAELIQSMSELLEKLGFTLGYIEPKNHEVCLNFSWQGHAHMLVGAFMIFRECMDSLLFVRGLRLKDISLDTAINNEQVSRIIKKIIACS